MRARSHRPPDDAPPRLSELVADAPLWTRDALCAEPRFADLDPFTGGAKADTFITEACAGCLVVSECGAYADALEIKDGVWGAAWRGATAKQEGRAA